MEFTTENKIIAGVVVLTLAIIIGGALLGGRNSGDVSSDSVSTDPDQILSEVVDEGLQERLVRDDSPAYFQGQEGSASDFADVRVTVVEFGDFECPACAAVAPLIEQLKSDNAEKSVRFVYRHFPLRQHENARPAAHASMEAYAQGKFWEYHDLLFAGQPALERDDLLGYARDLELDVAGFEATLDSELYDGEVQRDADDGTALRVTGTPSFFINGQKYEGQYSLDGFQAAIDRFLEEDSNPEE